MSMPGKNLNTTEGYLPTQEKQLWDHASALTDLLGILKKDGRIWILKPLNLNSGLQVKIRKTEWEVRPCDLSVARTLVEKYHYAHSASNTCVYTHGLFRIDSDECLGVAWWLPPTRVAVEATYDGDFRKVLSLTRLVVHPDVPANACSFLLSRSAKLIDHKKWHCLVTYADTWRGHTGAIYKATNWEYMGLTKPQPVWVDTTGRMMGKKRGPRNLTNSEMIAAGFQLRGRFAKHKYRFVLRVSQPATFKPHCAEVISKSNY